MGLQLVAHHLVTRVATSPFLTKTKTSRLRLCFRRDPSNTIILLTTQRLNRQVRSVQVFSFHLHFSSFHRATNLKSSTSSFLRNSSNILSTCPIITRKNPQRLPVPTHHDHNTSTRKASSSRSASLTVSTMLINKSKRCQSTNRFRPDRQSTRFIRFNQPSPMTKGHPYCHQMSRLCQQREQYYSTRSSKK